jgi:G3E family GTPase
MTSTVTSELLLRRLGELRDRIRIAMLVFELVDVDVDFDHLVDEAEQLKRVVRALKWRAPE